MLKYYLIVIAFLFDVFRRYFVFHVRDRQCMESEPIGSIDWSGVLFLLSLGIRKPDRLSYSTPTSGSALCLPDDRVYERAFRVYGVNDVH